ncbi:trypsin-like peptidase domain-containing protein [Pleurocapsales cyanobacterium LEGE 06147]|nr:trypsin-like peptidase domain-containing protein [Pleurocapsales cyanobacterium LEGE 06147]
MLNLKLVGIFFLLGLAIAKIESFKLIYLIFNQKKIPTKIETSLDKSANPALKLVANRSSAQRSVLQIARQVTVRILTNSGLGSGVIVERRGQIYTILTNYHVVADRPDQNYTVLTADGQTHQAQWLQIERFGNLDVALVQFYSHNSYQVVRIRDSNSLSVGDFVYASGFPAWHFTRQGNKITSLEDTRNWGMRAFRVTEGMVEMLSPKALSGGYQIGYSNDVVEGMSGGPVLNHQGELIGISGMLKYPLQGIEAHVFADGTMPSEQLFGQMEALSWAIPIENWQDQNETLIRVNAVNK